MEKKLLNDNELEQAQGGVDTSMLISILTLATFVMVFDPNTPNSAEGDLASSTSVR